MRKGFTAYHDMRQGMRKLSDAECGRLFRALLWYSETGEQPDNLQGREELLFDVYAQSIDREVQAYEATCARNKTNATRSDSQPVAPTRTDSHRVAATGSDSRQYKDEDEDKEKTKTKTKTSKDADASCAERPTVASTPPSGSGFVMTLNDGTGYDVPRGDIETYKRLYPAVDVESELRAMIGWCMSNPTKRKTRSGIARFINAWLKKEQDKGGSGGKSKANSATGEKARTYTAEDIIAILKKLGVDGVDIRFDSKTITADFIKKVHDAGFMFHVWTIDELEKAKLAFSRGAETVTTNCAKKMLDEFKGE